LQAYEEYYISNNNNITVQCAKPIDRFLSDNHLAASRMQNVYVVGG